jgi:predicted transcriptional regulator
MHDQPTPVEQDDRIDGSVLAMLLDHDAQRPWTEIEVAREVGHSDLNAEDSIRRLAGVGLVHRRDGFVFATRAAVHVRRLSL